MKIYERSGQWQSWLEPNRRHCVVSLSKTFQFLLSTHPLGEEVTWTIASERQITALVMLYIGGSAELSETQNYAYWYARFFPGTHDFR